MAESHTSVPKWDATPPAVDHTGTSYAVLAFGGDGGAVAAAWVAELGAGRPVWVRYADGADDTTLSALREQLSAARVGWRLLLAGPEADVLLARSVALGHGAVPAEIRAHATSTELKRVHCPHCKETTVAGCAVAQTFRCRGCGRTLMIHHHVSRRGSAYLGYLADAEAV